MAVLIPDKSDTYDVDLLLKAMNGISDIAVGHISITSERLKIVDFTCAIYQIDYGFMSRKPARLSSYRVRRYN